MFHRQNGNSLRTRKLSLFVYEGKNATLKAQVKVK